MTRVLPPKTTLWFCAALALTACSSPQPPATPQAQAPDLAAQAAAASAAATATAPGAVEDAAPEATLRVVTAADAAGRNASTPVQETPVAIPAPVTPARTAPPAAAAPSGASAAERAAFAAALAEDRNLPLDLVERALREARYSPTVAKAVLPPATPGQRSWPRYRARSVEPQRIDAGARFWRTHQQELARAEQRYGVPASVIVAIIGVETMYGRQMGSFRVLDALNTLGFHYPPEAPRDRSAYFRAELGEFIAFALQSGVDPATIRGSYAGAIGLPQFMPGSIRRFAVTASGQGQPDLINNPADAIASVANFLVEHGWQTGGPIFVPVNLPSDASALVDGGLTPKLSWDTLQAAGATVRGTAPGAPTPAWTSLPLGVIDLVDGPNGTAEYRVAAPNFFVITQYNRSYFYATSVAELSAALEQRNAR